MKIKDEIWILDDGRAGNLSQSLGLADELGYEYKIIKINFGFFKFLPNFFFKKSLIRIDRNCKKKLKNLNYYPNLIISAGRRLASTSLYLRKKSQEKSKIIQIMKPGMSFELFDFVILPKHDLIRSKKNKKAKNVIRTIGALTKNNSQKIEAEMKKFSSWFSNITEEKIALLLGGSSKNTDFSLKAAENLAEIISRITKNMKAKLLILTSRRSGEELSKYFESKLDCDYEFFNFEKYKKENPYLAILGYANFFVVTGDSVSMISECCSTQKPVYIFDDRMVSSYKHRKFHNNLFEEKIAKKLEKNLNKLEKYSYPALQENKRIAEIIQKSLRK
jgi:hypothetical protein